MESECELALGIDLPNLCQVVNSFLGGGVTQITVHSNLFYAQAVVKRTCNHPEVK